MKSGNLSGKVYKVVRSIPAGKVMTYGQIAKMVGTGPRVVGNILHNNPDPVKIPCHRVVNSKGKLSDAFAFGGSWEQAKRLEAEGVRTVKDRTDLNKYLFITIK